MKTKHTPFSLAYALVLVTILVGLAFVWPISADARISHSARSSTRISAKQFVDQAAVGGLFEIESSKLALQTSKDEEIQRFAQMMVDDHTRANEVLKQILSEKNRPDVMLPTSMDDKHQTILSQLANQTDQSFDDVYISTQVNAHEETVRLFQAYAANGDDAGLKKFAQDTLSILSSHMSQIKQLQMSRH